MSRTLSTATKDPAVIYFVYLQIVRCFVSRSGNKALNCPVKVKLINMSVGHRKILSSSWIRFLSETPIFSLSHARVRFINSSFTTHFYSTNPCLTLVQCYKAFYFQCSLDKNLYHYHSSCLLTMFRLFTNLVILTWMSRFHDTSVYLTCVQLPTVRLAVFCETERNETKWISI